MKFLRFSILILIFIPTLSHAVCETIRNVMVTGFEPFAERAQNGSQLTVEALAKQDPLKTCVRYQTCILPVEYEKGAAKAIECYEQSNPKPDIVMSMGEAGCDLRIETKGHNLNNARSPDNGGEVRVDEVIEDGGPQDSLITLPVPAMYCATQAEVGPPSRVSVTPGFYVCNDVTFRLAEFFKTKKVPFGFIHVPQATCKDVRPAETADKVTLMARSAIRTLSLGTTIFAENLIPCNLRESVYSSTTNEMIPLHKVVTAACQQQVINQLRVKSEKFEKIRPHAEGDVPSK